MDNERDDVINDFDQTNGKAPGLEGNSKGWADRNGDDILEGDEIDLANPFDAIDGDETGSVLGDAFEDAAADDERDGGDTRD